MTEKLPDKQLLRQELEETKQAFNKLLASVTPLEIWEGKSLNSRWSVAQLFSHMAHILDFYCRAVENARNNKATVPALPLGLLNWLNRLETRFKAGKLTPLQVAQIYDQNHVRLLALLDSIQPEEWDRRTRSPLSAGGFLTVATALRGPITHFQEHSRSIATNSSPLTTDAISNSR